MALLKADKIKQKDEIKNLISNSYGVIAWDYSGLDSHQVAEIKRLVKKVNGKDVVYKNRIIKIAFKELEKSEILNDLIGPSSFLFIQDEDSNALKELFNYVKKIDKKNLRLKAGYIGNEYFNTDSILEMASLPSKDELLGMLLSVLSGSMRNLAVVLSEVAKQRN